MGSAARKLSRNLFTTNLTRGEKNYGNGLHHRRLDGRSGRA